MQKRDQSLYERLQAYGKSDYAAFHMPGHKRRAGSPALPEGLPWEIDITEIDGFDDLHHPQGILKESMERAAAFYGVKKTLYSVNGSTAGILSAVFAVTKPGDTILMGRNCHKSVYHAVLLRELHPLYLYPQVEGETGIDCGYVGAELERMLTEHPQIKAVVLTSPTYEGVISDIQTLAGIVHRRGIPLIVDEAHGAHLTVRGQMEADAAGEGRPAAGADGRMPGGKEPEREEWNFPLSATALGADLVIQSVHKTLPSLTQTALLHICAGAADVLAEEAARYMSIFQTSSPSYVLIASIDACLRFMASKEGMEQRKEYALRLAKWRRKWKGLRSIRLWEPGAGEECGNGAECRNGAERRRGVECGNGVECGEEVKHRALCARQDASKLVFSADGLTGRELYERLRTKYHVQPEMCTPGYVLLMTGILDTEEMYRRLDRALCEMDESLCTGRASIEAWNPKPAVSVYSPAEADIRPKKAVRLWESAGWISAEYVYLYPPGIPLLVPGEEIRTETLSDLKKAGETGIEIKGLRDGGGERIWVLDCTRGTDG